MDKEKLNLWIERLNKAKEKNHEKIIAAMAKENNLKIDDALLLLKEAGFEAKASSDNSQQSNNNQQIKEVTILASHKTPYEKYRCAGLVLQRKPENYLVTEEQYEKLKKDQWVELK